MEKLIKVSGMKQGRIVINTEKTHNVGRHHGPLTSLYQYMYTYDTPPTVTAFEAGLRRL
jgi:hypothetical protein